MAKNTVITRKKRGPAPTGKGQLVGVRVLPPLMAKLDGWIGKQDDSPTRPEAIRRLVEKGLSLKPLPPGKPHKGAERAKEMAMDVVRKKLAGLPEGEKAIRKARLLKRPGQSKP